MEALTLNSINLPKNVEMIQKKSAIFFIRGERKAILKGRALEITNPIKELGSKLKIFSDEIIEKCHLGSIRGIVPKIENTIELQKILNKYFKTK